MSGVERHLAGEQVFHCGDVRTRDNVIPHDVVSNYTVLMPEDIPSASETGKLYVWVISTNLRPVFVLCEPICRLANFLERSYDRVLAHLIGKKFVTTNAVDEGSDERDSFGNVI